MSVPRATAVRKRATSGAGRDGSTARSRLYYIYIYVALVRWFVYPNFPQLLVGGKNGKNIYSIILWVVLNVFFLKKAPLAMVKIIKW